MKRLLPLLLFALPAQSAEYFDDFGSYSDGALGTVASSEWTYLTDGAGDWAEVVTTDGTAISGGKTLQIDQTSTGDALTRIALSAAAATTGDIEVVGRWKAADFDHATALSPPNGPALLDTATTGKYYWRRVSGTVWRLARATNQSASEDIGGDVTYAATDNAYTCVRIGKSGSTIRGRIWDCSSGLGSEPGTWQSSGTPGTLYSSMQAGITVNNFSPTPYAFDFIGVGTAGDSAPTSGGGGDDTPNAFSFTDQTNVALSDTITSAAVTIDGIDVEIECTATGGTIDLNGDDNFQSTQDVNDGDEIRARHTSSASNSTAVNTVVDCNGVSDTFTSTTEAAESSSIVPIIEHYRRQQQR